MNKPRIVTLQNLSPKIDPSSFIAESAFISGDVEIGKEAGIWYNCVIRGDVAKIVIGDRTNIQDGTIIHGSRPGHVANKTSEHGGPVIIGKNVTVGHGCILHACIIEDEAFVGMGSLLMDMAIVERGGMLAAGSLLSPHKVVKAGQIWAGRPAKFLREMTQEEKDFILVSADNYWRLAQEYESS